MIDKIKEKDKAGIICVGNISYLLGYPLPCGWIFEENDIEVETDSKGRQTKWHGYTIDELIEISKTNRMGDSYNMREMDDMKNLIDNFGLSREDANKTFPELESEIDNKIKEEHFMKIKALCKIDSALDCLRYTHVYLKTADQNERRATAVNILQDLRDELSDFDIE